MPTHTRSTGAVSITDAVAAIIPKEYADPRPRSTGTAPTYGELRDTGEALLTRPRMPSIRAAREGGDLFDA